MYKFLSDFCMCNLFQGQIGVINLITVTGPVSTHYYLNIPVHNKLAGNQLILLTLDKSVPQYGHDWPIQSCDNNFLTNAHLKL